MSIPTDQHEILVTARMNALYHEGLERFYTQFLGWTAFFSVLFSSAAFAALGNLWLFADNDRSIFIGIFAFLVAAMNGAVLAFGMQSKLSQHADLKRQWIGVIERAQLIPNEEPKTLKPIQQAIAQLCAIEPAPSKRRLEKALARAHESMGLTPQH